MADFRIGRLIFTNQQKIGKKDFVMLEIKPLSKWNDDLYLRSAPILPLAGPTLRGICGSNHGTDGR